MSLHITKYQRALRWVRGDIEGVLGPGTWRWRQWKRILRPGWERLEIVDTMQTRLIHPKIDVLVEHPEVRKDLLVIDLTDRQRALLWKDGRLFELLGPGRHAFWKSPYALAAEVLEITGGRFEHAQIDAILAHPASRQWFTVLQVPKSEITLVYQDGRLIDRVEGGRYAYWSAAGELTFKNVDLREQTSEIAGQEIMTKDKVTLRMTLLVTWKVIDVERAVSTVQDWKDALYRNAQLVLRRAIASRTLDTLLQDKESVDAEISGALVETTSGLGLEVIATGLRDVILPGDMKALLNRVIEAEKEAQANLIRRREETAAARSQANTARLLAENPILARMKELEMVQEILAGAQSTFVFGKPDLLEGLRGLVRKEGDVS
ncbi:MAG: peptidase [Planctomycetes bacterium]|nr:peptidase [Planctomycetota bacterium]